LFSFVERTFCVGFPVRDPFRTVAITGELVQPDGSTALIEGFCDSSDGSVYRIRFMPTQEGTHRWSARVEGPGVSLQESGSFDAVDKGAKGILEAEGWGFLWSRSREPFFWNATTAYLLAGLREDVAFQAIDRLAKLGINRIRVALCPTRQQDGGRWSESQVKPREDFTFLYGPWPARQPDSQSDPQFDVSRFDIAYWQKFERILSRAASHGMIVHTIFFVDAQENQNYPFEKGRVGDDPDERRYFSYAVARLAPFWNVEWCITNEWALYRPDEWVEALGSHMAQKDPYGHLCTVHGHDHFPFRASSWCTHATFQVWDEDGGYDWVTENRREQMEAGSIKPQVNEEYGYEDHYPVPWGGGKVAPARNADNRRRLAWEITMAGAWQTNGESAANGLGGWINGLGDDSMTMFHGVRHMASLFGSLPWSQLEPRPELSSPALRVMEGPGIVVLYQPEGGPLPDPWSAQGIRGWNPRTGEWADAPDGEGDWVWVVESVP
jgi:hypothetical protein